MPAKGQIWEWLIKPPYLQGADGKVVPYSGEDLERKRVCGVQVIALKQLASGDWADDPTMHGIGTLALAIQGVKGGELWEGSEQTDTWFSRGCERPLPLDGFAFQATLTKDERDRAQVRRVRFRLTHSGKPGRLREPTDPPLPPHGLGDTVTTVDTWTDPAGDERATPLSGPVTTVAIVQEGAPADVDPSDQGLGGLLAVVGQTTVVRITDGTAANLPYTVFTSLERDWNDDDPTISGLRTVAAPVPSAWGIGVSPGGARLSGLGTATATIAVPPIPSLVGKAFWIQVGVGPSSEHGLSGAIRVRLIHSFADYDGDGLLNDDDDDPVVRRK